MNEILAAAMVFAAFACACSTESANDAAAGGSAGASTGGENSGGASSGGASTGGESSGGASTGGESSGGASTGGESSGGASSGCEILLNQAEHDTGFETCADGTKRRRLVLECPTERTSQMSPCMPGFGPPDCMSDDECTDEPFGYCADAHNLTGYCGCYYGCRQDSDCEVGSLCECGVVVGRCVPASCTTNDDCAPGFGCVASVNGSPGATCLNVNPTVATSYACQTAADECSSDEDCPDGGNASGTCFLDGDHRVCGTACLLTP